MNFKTKPYAHQLAAFEKFEGARFFALFMDMGTGKSKVAIDVASAKFERGEIDRMLVVAPNNVHAQWIKEQFPAHASIRWRPFVWDSAKTSRKLWAQTLESFLADESPLLRVLAVNVEAFQSDSVLEPVRRFVTGGPTFAVIDEATRIKTPKAKRTKALHALGKLCAARAILTGTPTAKSPFDLWSQMEFLKPGYFGCSFFMFEHRYGVLMRGTNARTGGRYTTLIDEKTWGMVASLVRRTGEQRGGALNVYDYEMIASTRGVSESVVKFIEAQGKFQRFRRLDELREAVAPVVFSARKEDCLDLPPKVYEVLPVSMTDEQRRVYRQLKEELRAEYAGREVSVTNKVALTTRLMQVAGGFFPHQPQPGDADQTVGPSEPIGDSNPKLDALVGDLEETADDARVIVWAAFVPELRAIHERLTRERVSCSLYYGATSSEDRAAAVKALWDGSARVLVCNAATAGFGLNLQCASLQYFYSNTFRTEDRLQAEDRSHRIGARSTVVYKDIVTRGTIDERVASSISSGRGLNDYFKGATVDQIISEGEEAET